MKKLVLLLSVFSLLLCLSASAQSDLSYFLPGGVSFNKEIPAPKDFTGHEIGEWHLTHDQLYQYMKHLAELSDRAIWEEYGRSYEDRPLGQLIISSPENIRNLEKLRTEHLMLCDPQKSGSLDITKMPVFIKLGYGVHGNESSAQNASALVAYYLIAARDNKIDELLRNTVILIDPALNPDGMQRHSTWVNMTKSLNNNPDPNSWEFSEPWPGGRTNHYWFDLNRDYIMLQHPESVGRVAAFYKWRPNINTDHHEMGANATFFFQPGVQSRNNPLTPEDNQLLTAEIGKYHEAYLNAIKSLYFTEESFDDFYVGKGSSYPDIHGSVGILFEQAGVKGHLRETPGGLLSFPFAIKNHVTVSFSTLDAGLSMKDKLLESQRNFYKEALVQADKYYVKAFLFSEPSDKGRLNAFITNLLRHNISVYHLAKNTTVNGSEYKAADSYIVPLHQNEYRFIRSLFEPVKSFTDSVFYDISTWVLPMSFNIKYTSFTNPKDADLLKGELLTTLPENKGSLSETGNPYAWLMEWNEYFAPKALYELQTSGIIARVATDKFSIKADGSLKEFSFGTILIPASGQNISSDAIKAKLSTIASKCGVKFFAVETGLTPAGIDLGSNAFFVLHQPSIALITGEGSQSAVVGEIWHLLDSRFGIQVSLITPSKFSNLDLDRYNVVIVAGSPDISQQGIENMRTWNKRGGTIIAVENGNSWLVKNKLAEIDFVPKANSKIKNGIYLNRANDNQAQLIPGSIFETKLDLTHPLCYGYDRAVLPVFKSSETVASKDQNAYNNPVVYTSDPLLSGYCTKANTDRIKGSAFASVHGSRVISLYDDPNFRAIWYGTSKIFLNAIFFGQIIGSGGQEYSLEE